MIQEIITSFFPWKISWMYTGHHKILCKVRGWIGVIIGKIFVLVYFMFQGIWIILGGIYLLVKIINCGGMGRPPPLRGKFHQIYLYFYLTLPLGFLLILDSSALNFQVVRCHRRNMKPSGQTIHFTSSILNMNP